MSFFDRFEPVSLAILPALLSVGVSVHQAAAQTCVDPPAGIVSWWPGDGDALDIVGPNDATLVNGAAFGPGYVGQAFSLDGIDDVVDLGDNYIPDSGISPFTTVAWIFPTRTPSGSWYFVIRLKQDAQFFLVFASDFMFSGDLVGATFRRQSHQWYTPIDHSALLNLWTHVAVTYDGGDRSSPSSFRIYFDGNQLPSGTVDLGPVGRDCSDSVIGADNGGGASCAGNDYFFQGLIDEIAVFNRALSAEEIGAICNAGSSGMCRQPANTPPTPDAGPNLTIASESLAETTILGTATDLDSDPLSYRWLEGEIELTPWEDIGTNGEAFLDLGAIPFLSLGEHVLVLEVGDGQTTSSDQMLLTIANSSPHPAPTGSGIYQIGTSVTLGAQASDFDGDGLDYQWLEGETVLFSGQVQAIFGGDPINLPDHVKSGFGLGAHALCVRLNDGVNDPVSSCINVEVIDSTAPTLAPVPDSSILWPPNHQMANVVIHANAFDNSGSVVLSAAISSNEPEDGLGDGDQAPDWTAPAIDQEGGTITLDLRAERSGSGGGRIYAIAITATDESQNASQAILEIVVPHDRKGQ